MKKLLLLLLLSSPVHADVNLTIPFGTEITFENVPISTLGILIYDCRIETSTVVVTAQISNFVFLRWDVALFHRWEVAEVTTRPFNPNLSHNCDLGFW